jgi:phage tail-like protein
MINSPDHTTSPVVTAPRFVVQIEGWTVGLSFSELAGFTSDVEFSDYSYNSRLGNVHTTQFGRTNPPSVTLKRALDAKGFAQLYGWHMLARQNAPLAKAPAAFAILPAGGDTPAMECTLENAWCARLEISAAKAGDSNPVMMTTTIVCDSITQS